MQPDTKADDSTTTGPNPPLTGHAIDSHFTWLRTRMSAERTLMCWNRTSPSLLSFGFTIYQLFEHLQQATVGVAAIRP